MSSDNINVLITGASRGLGLATAKAATHEAHVICAGRDAVATERAAREIGGEPIHLDLTSLDAVLCATAALPHVDAVACNAGIQLLHDAPLTEDNFEQTFQVNHLAHLVLVDALLARPHPPRRVVFLGSGTHDPAIRTGTPDPLDGDVESMARNVNNGQDDARTAGLRRYTTSKMLAIAAAGALARQHPEVQVNAFDPGLMPGTGLARDFPAGFRLLWNTILKGLRVLPFASSARASGTALAQLLVAEPCPAASGKYVNYKLESMTPSVRAADPAFQDSVLRDSRAIAEQAMN